MTEPLKLLDLSLACNTADGRLLENLLSACKRPLPWVQQMEARDGAAVLVGGGPSLGDPTSRLELNSVVEAGGTVFALGNAAKWLHENGFPVHFQVIADARPGNAEFIHPASQAYMIASQCDSAVFDAVEHMKPVWLWHANMGPELNDKIPRNQALSIVGGGPTVGLSAMCLSYVLGFRTLHLFGYDSSSREGKRHAFDQSLGVHHGDMEAVHMGKKYYGQPAMIGQARSFPNIATALADLDTVILVHGDGLLPAVAHSMSIDAPSRWVVECDLGKVPSRWDFFNWLLIMEMERRRHNVESMAVRFTAGPKDGFRDDGLPETVQQRREMLDNLLRPLLGMIGVSETEEEADFTATDYRVKGIVERWEQGVPLPHLEPGLIAEQTVRNFLAAGERPVVITLREAPHWPQRNSNLPEWLEFAQSCGRSVVFVRDTAKADEPLDGFRTFPLASRDVRVRLALYRRAFVNMFVGNGPGELALISQDVPYLMFNILGKEWGSAGTPEFFEKFTGVKVGGQFPWATDHQRIIWEGDDFPSLQRAFNEFLSRASVAA